MVFWSCCDLSVSEYQDFLRIFVVNLLMKPFFYCSVSGAVLALSRFIFSAEVMRLMSGVNRSSHRTQTSSKENPKSAHPA